MDEEGGSDSKINFIPCLTWVRRGVARPEPERVRLTQEELAAVITQTQKDLKEIDEESGGEEKENKLDGGEDMVKVKEEEPEEKATRVKVEEPEEKATRVKVEKVRERTDEDIMDEYGLDDYDDEQPEDVGKMLGIGDLTVFSDPREDPYLDPNQEDEDQEDKEDFLIRGTDNLILAGHVEGESATLEVYIYNDVEDALYVHHDILLPSLPLALEWLSFDPESETKGNMVAVGSMQPIIEVWDLDIVDCLEPAFRLGRKARKKKGIPGVGHKDAVLSLAWNPLAEHVLASGSVDETVILWDLTSQTVASTLRYHKEKVQSLSWHPTDLHSLATGCCDGRVRVADCRSQQSHRAWRVAGEVERVLWNHFSPFHCLASTDAGTVHCIDVRMEAPLWTLSGHSAAVTGLALSSQSPGCLVTASSDKTMKVWDISTDKPEFIYEKNMKLGVLQTVTSCPDAPFVVCLGGDNPSQNFLVTDIRESPQVLERFSSRQLVNPLWIKDKEPIDPMEIENTAASLETMMSSSCSGLAAAAAATAVEAPRPSGGAAAKFKNKDKKKKKKKSDL